MTDQREALEASVRDARADRDGLRTRLAKATTDKERSRLRAPARPRDPPRDRSASAASASSARPSSYATVELSVQGDKRSGAAVAARRSLDARRRAAATPCACSRSSRAC